MANSRPPSSRLSSRGGPWQWPPAETALAGRPRADRVAFTGRFPGSEFTPEPVTRVDEAEYEP